ncbi:CotH kinase family protein [Saccharibacillus sp. CPCC 101409]|uniref:CotH kinase family protein n=1 Tax=Saccharibacillus sp. CPCC 101409 TaxID=3058041 RepID=UPI002672F584|nr:CotH kinase family protein [Saccharibacillus sp. CPCC 101409]MDO3411578.1 CotH kinase family protein [Saccharibacillus sp. CPCC 101409]
MIEKTFLLLQLLSTKKAALASGLMAAAALLASCSNDSAESAAPAAPKQTAAAAADADSQDGPLQEDKRIYERDKDTRIDTLYLTVPPQTPGADQPPLDWAAFNRVKDRAEESELDVIVQEGADDGSGPKAGAFGYAAEEANGKIALRGNTARYVSQHSYKIKLDDRAGLWNDQSILNLNKHPYDPSRFRNKLGFDLFETMPDMASLRTRFVHLYVKDLSDGAASSGAEYEDYGLFTQIEQPNKKFLKNHWLDPYGDLYKATMFEFLQYPEALKAKDDPVYDRAAFEQHLEIQGREDHTKLIAMLDDVNNMSIPIDEVMEKHFDLDNYLTWMAGNILMDNMDTNAQNFLLYSPLNSEKWYFLPWDYDGAWELQRKIGSIGTYNNGISNYWGGKLHNRFFRDEKNVQLLKNKIDELYRGYINEKILSDLIAKYRPITEAFARRGPDKYFFPIPVGDIPADVQEIAKVPKRSIERFEQDIQDPKPFFLNDIQQKDAGILFSWGDSFDLQGDDLTYTFTLAEDPLFEHIVKQEEVVDANLTLKEPAAGTYYWKVIVRDTGGHSQTAFDIYYDAEGAPYYGIRQIEVK